MSSFLKQFSRGVLWNFAEFANIFETIGLWNIGLHNCTNEILGTWFQHVPIVVGQPNLVSSFLKQFSRGVLLDLADFSSNFETIVFWNIGLHNFTKEILGIISTSSHCREPTKFDVELYIYLMSSFIPNLMSSFDV